MNTSCFTRFGKVIIVALLFLIACSKDKIDSPIVGNWQGSSFITSEPVDENGDGTANTNLTNEMDCVSMEAEFTAHGRYSLISTDATYDVQITDEGVKLVLTGCASTTETGHWSINDASTVLFLEFDIPGKEEPFLVEVQVELSEQRLVMKNLLYSEDPPITYSVEFVRK